MLRLIKESANVINEWPLRHQEDIHGKIVIGLKKCSRCDYSTNTNMKLKSHTMRCLKSDEMFTCKICEYRSGTSTGLAIHFKNNHPNEKYQKICLGNKKCTRCDYSTTTTDRLNKHKKKCLKSSELFTCESCDYKSGTSLGLSIHFKISHPNQKLYKKCSRCDYASDSDYKLNQHEKRCLKSDKLFKCVDCGHKSGTPLALSLHIKNIHPDLIFRCENCDFTTQRLNDFESHSRNCSISSCFICDFTSYKKPVMKTHLELEHKLTNFDCDLCSFETKELTKLKTHIEAVHLGKKNFKCKLCDFATGWPTHLKKHMETHIKEPKKCEIEGCDIIANNKQELKNHMKDNHGMEIDNDLEKFKCQKCDYRSNFTNSLKVSKFQKQIFLFSFEPKNE